MLSGQAVEILRKTVLLIPSDFTIKVTPVLSDPVLVTPGHSTLVTSHLLVYMF